MELVFSLLFPVLPLMALWTIVRHGPLWGLWRAQQRSA